MSETDINTTVNVTEDIYADVDSTAMSAAVIDDGDSIVVPAEVDFGHTLDTELEDNDLIDVPVDESVGIAGDHRVLIHRDAPNQHPMSAITGLNDALAGIDTALSSRISQVEAETADLDVDMADALLRIGDLQDQVDGNITTWFYAAEPAMNLPPVAYDPSNPHDTGWDTDDKKNAHKGDLYYNTLTGYAYRFAYSDGAYGWMRITDTDVVKALADAAKAQDTADSKRRVFYTTPYPPYDKGDLWVQGGSGDILVCTTDKPADGSYSESDWSRASKYTDDTVADIALASANGKNTVYHQASQPTGGTYKKGDTWFDTDDDYTMYTYDGSLWIKEQFGNEAIADMSITNAKIANATIEYGKIKSVDAGKITVGDLAADRIKASVITAVNGSTETSGGSSLKISADKVNIQGVITAINNDTTTTIDGDKITTGTLSASAVNATSGTFNTANIPELTANHIKTNVISAINSNTGTVQISASKVDIAGAAVFNNYSTTQEMDDAIGDAVDGIEVGGRNLLSDTKAFGTKNTTGIRLQDVGGTSLTSNEYNGTIIRNYPSYTLSSGARNIVQYSFSDAKANEVLKHGQSYCLSFWAKGSGKFRTYLYSSTASTDTSYCHITKYVASDGEVGTAQDGAKIWTLTSEWKRYWIVYTFADAGHFNDRRILFRHDYNASATLEGDFCGIKFEAGNKATEWTPAPEDVQAEIDAKKSVHTLSTSYSWGYSAILGYAAEGTSTNFNVTSTSGVLVGDTVRLKVAVHDMNEAPVYIVGTVTAILSDVTLTIQAHGLDTTVIDGGNILTNSIGANQIAANSIGAKHITISDSTNLATANEIYESSLPTALSSDYQPVISSGYLVKKTATQQFLMLTDYTPNNFKQNDELYYEFYGKAAVAGTTSLYVWGYSGTPPTHTYLCSNSLDINLTTSEARYSGTLKLTSANWNNATQYIIGFSDGRSTKSQIHIRKAIVRRKNAGELIVDGSITSDHISANKISANKIKVEEITIGAAQIGSGTIDTARIPDLSADKITSGTIEIGHIPDGALNSNIKLGGRNLLLNTSISNRNCGLCLFSTGYVTPAIANETLCYKITGSNTVHGFNNTGSWSCLSSPLKANTTYTYSFWARYSKAADFNFTSFGHFQVNNANSSASDKTHEDVADKRVYSPSSVAANTWTKMSITFTTNNLANSSFGIYPLYNNGADTVMYAYGFKLEEGNKATDWTPAPEDSFGENLLKGTDATTVSSRSIASSSSSSYAEGETFIVPRVTGETTYIVSFDAKASAATNVNCYWYSPNTTTAATSSTRNASGSADGACQVALTTSWQRYWVCWVQSDSVNTDKRLIVGRTFKPSSGTLTVDLRAIKMEVGSIATPWSVSPDDLAATATDYITDIDTKNGITIKAVNSTTDTNASTGNYIKLNASGLEVYKGGASVAQYGDTVRVGKASTRHVEVKDGGMQVYQDSSTVMAHIGYGSGNAMSGTATAPYYTLGTRTSGSSVGNYSVAEGYNNTASGYSSHAEGQTTVASGTDSHAEGYGTTASGTDSHAEGSGNTASGAVSHAEGKDTTASGQYSHAEGYGTIAAGTGQTAIGIFNVSDSTSLFIIGKGNSSTRANAFSVASNGTVYVNGTSVHSSDRRLKEHIAYLGDEAVEFINNLKPAHYIKDDAKHVGFYAQDVAEVDKWDCMIGEEMNGYMTLGYMELLAPMVAYIQRLEKRIEELERSK